METKTVKIYEFSELDIKIQKKVLDRFREHCDFMSLEEDLFTALSPELKAHKIKVINKLQLNYSLSNCQGDGLCFTGIFQYKSYSIYIEHSGHYYHSCCVNINMRSAKTDKEANDNTLMAFESLYRNICAKMEKIGYEIIENETSDATIKDNIEANDYRFYDDGIIYKE